MLLPTRKPVHFPERGFPGKLGHPRSVDCTARVWKVGSRCECLLTLSGHSKAVLCAAFSRDGREIVTCSADGTVRVWCAESGELKALHEVNKDRHRLNRYLAQQVPSCFLVSSFRTCLNYAVLQGMSGGLGTH